MKTKNVIVSLVFGILLVFVFGFTNTDKSRYSEYSVVTRTDMDDLERQVERNLNQGFECVGGVSVYHEGTTLVYAQAMVK